MINVNASKYKIDARNSSKVWCPFKRHRPWTGGAFRGARSHLLLDSFRVHRHQVIRPRSSTFRARLKPEITDCFEAVYPKASLAPDLYLAQP